MAKFAGVLAVSVPEKVVLVSSRPMVMVRSVEELVLVTLPAPAIEPQVCVVALLSRTAPASIVMAERIGILAPEFAIRRPPLIQVVPRVFRIYFRHHLYLVPKDRRF